VSHFVDELLTNDNSLFTTALYTYTLDQVRAVYCQMYHRTYMSVDCIQITS